MMLELGLLVKAVIEASTAEPVSQDIVSAVVGEGNCMLRVYYCETFEAQMS
jgi:hypothetical protein